MENYYTQKPLSKLGNAAMNNILQQLQQIHQQIKQASHAVGREQSAVKLLAVSKTKPVEDILIAYAAGQVAFSTANSMIFRWNGILLARYNLIKPVWSRSILIGCKPLSVPKLLIV